MAMIPEIADAVWDVLTDVADACAQEAGWVRRRSKLTGARFVQTLVLGWLQAPAASLSLLAATAGRLGVRISPQGLDQRFTPAAADCLADVLDEAVTAVVTADPVAIPVLARFNGVYVQDSTVVGLPDELAGVWQGTGERTGHNQAAVKATVRLDLLRGGLDGLALTDGRTHDRTAARALPDLPAGSLLLRDLGYFGLDDLAALVAAAGFFLQRLQAQTLIWDAAGRAWEQGAWLGRQRQDVIDQPVRIGAAQALPVRLLAVKVPPAVAAERRRKLRAAARRNGQTPSAARLRLADWTILVTNVPADRLTVEEALVLARARWQIELLFKLWKQHGQLDESRSAQPWRRLCEFYAKLIGLVIQHWLVLTGSWQAPSRSLVNAAAIVRQDGVLLVKGMAGQLPLVWVIAEIVRDVAAACRVNTRKTEPNLYQRLLALDAVTLDAAA